MAALSKEMNSNTLAECNLKKDYPWFCSYLYEPLVKYTKEFFKADFGIRFMGISYDENILFYGDEYFVNKIPVNKSTDFTMKLSSEVVELLLDAALGSSEDKFNLKNLTEIEAMLIKSFTVYVYKHLENKISKAELNKKNIQNKKNLNFTFFVRNKKQHVGKIIITIPDYALSDIEVKEFKPVFDLDDFSTTYSELKLGIGKSKIALNDIKAIEEGDIIVLEHSDINRMSVMKDGEEITFRINPNPSLIISIDNNGGNEMEEETSVKPQNMWDSILVDIVAEFDNVKLTLGELKQISEGLVIDVGSVYENKVKLRVENQVVATGELVILNDRYGVRIDSVNKTKEAPKKSAPKEKAVENQQAANPQKAEAKAAPSKEKPAKEQAGNEEENFDYSDFEPENEEQV